MSFTFKNVLMQFYFLKFEIPQNNRRPSELPVSKFITSPWSGELGFLLDGCLQQGGPRDVLAANTRQADWRSGRVPAV